MEPSHPLLRTYYSETLTGNSSQNEFLQERYKNAAPVTMCSLWLLKSCKYAPILKELTVSEERAFLEAAENWLTFGTKPVVIPAKAYNPKVQSHLSIGGLSKSDKKDLKVQMEELRRFFASCDISKVLSKEYRVSCFHIVPVDDHLPLELFDDEEYDSRTTDEWLRMAEVENVRYPVPATAFVKIMAVSSFTLSSGDNLLNRSSRILQSIQTSASMCPYKWTDVGVLSYDVKTKLFNVITLSDPHTEHRVTRIYLHFKAENPYLFAARVNNAVTSRDYAENMIKYEYFVDCMPTTGIPSILQSSIDRIKKISSFGTRKKQKESMAIKELILIEQAKLWYARTGCSFVLQDQAKKNPSRFPFVMFPAPTIEIIKQRLEGKLDFKEILELLQWTTLYSLSNTVDAMGYVVSSCLTVMEYNMFNTLYSKNVNLEEFERAQTLQTNNIIKILQGTWIEEMAHKLRMSLDDVGKGWFNIYERKWEIYEVSKLSHFMTLVKLRMQTALRISVLNSLKALVDLIEGPSRCIFGCKEDFVWGEDVVETLFKPAVTPIFVLHLKIDDNGAYYTTNPDQFEKVLLKLVDNAVILSNKVPQVDPFVLTKLKYPEDLYLSPVGLLQPEVTVLRDRLISAIRAAVIPLVAYCKEYNKHASLYSLNVDEYIQKYKEENHLSSEVKDEVALQLRLKANLQVTIPPMILIGPFIVHTDSLKQFLVNKRHEIATKQLISYADRMKLLIEDAMEEYKHIYRKLCEKPVSIEHIFEIRDWMETIPLTVRGQDDLVRKYLLEYQVLDAFWWPLEQEAFEAKWEAVGWPYRLQKKIEEVNDFLDEETDKFQKIQVDDEFTMQDRIELITVNIAHFAGQWDISKVHELAVDIRRAWKLIKESQEFGQLLNQRQKLFGMPVTPFDQLHKLLKEFEPYKNLWTTASDWLKSHLIYMDNPLVNVDGESIERTVNEYYKTMVKCYRTFSDMPEVQAIAHDVRDQIDNFKPYIPLIQALRNPGMRQRHWDKLADLTGVKIQMTPILTFNKCLALGLGDHPEVMAQISDEAGKEYVIEQALDKMSNEWDSIIMEVTPYKQTGTYILKVTDEILQLLDDHILLTQQLTFSPFKGAFEERLFDWESKLRLAQEVLDQWFECQKTWMYLEPIFKSEDITQQLPLESKKFNTMEMAWRRTMKAAFENPKIMYICPDKRLLELLRNNNKLLAIVYKGLSEYLEMKRSKFPRFYFLSDDELLEILAQGRNPRAVQPHLRKCFENIYKLNFEEDLCINKMYSGEGECVELIPDMYPTGSVEEWLLKVEDTMRNTLRMTFSAALSVIENANRSEWVLIWPGQVVIAGCQTYWSAHVEDGILKHRLKEYFDLMLEQLDGLRGLVKGKLTRVQRQVLSALIVIEVHARDVLENLVHLNVQNVNEFDWISQLRYYWVEDQLKVRAVNAEFQYGYEYLGNSGRLVITPLTDRCYLTLTGALHLKFGGAPAGPAGTGKTETTKDLAKAFAIQCVVFNCSDQLDFMAMGKFFKGLASSGAWACFDEFNRIDIEVLSVVAQQITTIQKAQMARLDRIIMILE